ncbi:glucose-6-phosphatase catalytic subunit 1-like isoform X2 [Centropristis striata]|uniref:glucose-6-phosphatase catalytic subunit 1-like isoform X2 n=1 Tax=Centropristis striata TaxID=184440 RepID=UPI0027E17547|nr:glucose-6-phosphatase catalytic subunit 1-like isoform X2 [Centropristis striata]
MDLLHSSGVSSTHYLQTHFSQSQGYFLSVSMATDIRNTFFLLFPIWFHVKQAEAIKLLWVAVVGDWINLMLKWLLFGERPYWWVHETGYYDNSSQPLIAQFPMTCETGPGSPSGHAMGAAAVYYTMMSSLLATVLKKEGHQIRKWCVRVSLWTLFWCVQLCVCLSRVFVAAHFPHQVITGVFPSGILVAESLSRTQKIYNADLRSYLLTSLLLLSLALLLYLCLQLVGVDLLWSVEKARCWCHRAEWVSVDTSPLASLFRNTGALLGLGLGLHSPLRAHSKAVVASRGAEGAVYRSICVSATLVLLQLFDSAFMPPVHSGALFYLLSLCKSAMVPLATVAIVPYCVTAALGYRGEKLL